MASGPMPELVRHVRRLAGGGADITDAQLLDRFVESHDTAAFELLVRRHAAMAFGVCRRVLRDAHEAEDVFQAAWLTLARKAGTIGKRKSLGSWLYKVAYRIALRARESARARGALASAIQDRTRRYCEPDHAEDRRELRALLDEELGRLPEKYRAPIILCYLEGMTNEEAAGQLRWAVGTVKTRLARARGLLAERLTRRGLGVSGSVVGALLAENIASGGLRWPVPLLRPTIQGAIDFVIGQKTTAAVSPRVAGLTQGVIQAMMWTKLKLAGTMILAASMLGGGVGVLTCSSQAGQSGTTSPVQPVTIPERTEPHHPQERTTSHELLLLKDNLRVAEANLALAHAQVERAKADLALQESELKKLRQEPAPVRSSPCPGEKMGATDCLVCHNVSHGTANLNQAVAFVFQRPITRAELGEYLVERVGVERVLSLVNLRIIEEAARAHGINVSEAEVADALRADIKITGTRPEKFIDQILGQRHQSLAEWKQDVIRPRLLMTRLCQSRVHVNPEEVREAFEARYGAKITCKLLEYPKDQLALARHMYELIREDRTSFDRVALQQASAGAAAAKEQTVTVSRHSTDNPELEKTIFGLEPDGVGWGETKHGYFIMRAVKRIPPDQSVRFEDVFKSLEQEVRDRKIQAEIPKYFEELRRSAQPRVVLESADKPVK